MLAACSDCACGAPAPSSPVLATRSMIAFLSMRAESFHFSTCLVTAALDTAAVHRSLLTGPYCVVTNVRNWSSRVLTAGIRNVALKYAVFCDGTSAQQAKYDGRYAGLVAGSVEYRTPVIWPIGYCDCKALGVCANPT